MLPTPGDFVLTRQAERIGIKSALMEYAALRRDLPVRRISRLAIAVEFPDGRQLAFYQMNGPRSSQVGRYLCDRKEHCRELLHAAGFSVTPSQLFGPDGLSSALSFIESLDGAAVVKPTRLSRGKGITTGIESPEQFREAWGRAFNAYRRPEQGQVLVEQHMDGEDFRFYVVGKHTVFATHRKRANVTGDGRSSIGTLIEAKNAERAQNPYLGSYLIPTNLGELDRLAPAGLSLDSVPAFGEEITLRGASNLSAGGDSIDWTEQMHPGFREMVVRAVEAIPGMEYAGVDVIAPDIAQAPTSENHVIGEVEYSPAPLADFPAEGEAHDMAGALLEHYLSQTG